MDQLVAKLLNYGIPLQNRIIELDYLFLIIFFFYLGFTSCEAEQSLQSIELHEKEGKRLKNIHKRCL